MKIFFLCLKHFGINDGVKLFLALKIREHTTLDIKGFDSPIYLRHRDDDVKIFEKIFLKKICELPAAQEPLYIVDLDANIGLASIFFARRYPQARIIAIEQEIRNFTFLCKNTRHYRNVNPIRVSVLLESANFCAGEDLHTDLSYYLDHGLNENSTRKIQTAFIESILEDFDFPRIDVLKIDRSTAKRIHIFLNTYSWLRKTRIVLFGVDTSVDTELSLSLMKVLLHFDFLTFRSNDNVFAINTQLL